MGPICGIVCSQQYWCGVLLQGVRSHSNSLVVVNICTWFCYSNILYIKAFTKIEYVLQCTFYRYLYDFFCQWRLHYGLKLEALVSLVGWLCKKSPIRDECWGYMSVWLSKFNYIGIIYRVMQKKNTPTFETLPFPQFLLKRLENSKFDIVICFWSSSKI